VNLTQSIYRSTLNAFGEPVSWYGG